MINKQRWYILDDNGNPIPEPDTIKACMWLADNKNKIVKQENVGPYWVSTVFLGLDHSWRLDGPPVLWETMVFNDGDKDIDQNESRCSGNREQAEAMHEAMVASVKAYIASKPKRKFSL